MKNGIVALLLSVGFSAASAQAPATAPAGSTGACKDGTYSQAPSKRGACAGHKGVKDWYAADATAATKTPAAATPAAATPAVPAAPMAKAATPAPAAPMATATPAAPAPKAAVTPATKPINVATTPAAAGGGAGQVWVNTSSKVYHCEGSKYYGKTKAGSYMTESAAMAAGAHADHGKACKAA